MTVRRDASLLPRQVALKIAFRTLIERIGGVELASTMCRVGKSNLSDYCSINTDSFAPIDVVADLQEHARASEVTQALAIRNGDVIVKIPAAPAGARDWLGGMAALSREIGDAQSRIANALKDGDVSGREAQGIVKEIDDAAPVLMALRALAERAMEEA